MIQSPVISRNIFSPEDFSCLSGYLQRRPKSVFDYDERFGRYFLSNDPILNFYHEQLVPVARSLFSSHLLVPSYALFARYEGPAARLPRHKDDNACTYTVDLCVYQKEPWPLFVEDHELVLQPNEAAVYFGNDQLHWREPMQDPSNYVGMIFFHFVDPGHWYLTQGPQHIQAIRAKSDAP
jgi:hypothetical protein